MSQDTNSRPSYVSTLLLIKIKDGISFDEAKQSLEHMGLTVQDLGLSWKRSVVMVIAPSKDLDEWITRLLLQPIVARAEKVALHTTSN